MALESQGLITASGTLWRRECTQFVDEHLGSALWFSFVDPLSHGGFVCWVWGRLWDYLTSDSLRLEYCASVIGVYRPMRSYSTSASNYPPIG